MKHHKIGLAELRRKSHTQHPIIDEEPFVSESEDPYESDSIATSYEEGHSER